MADATLAHAFVRIARESPDAVAVVDRGEPTSYGELLYHARCFAGLLREGGIGPGDVIGIELPRSRDTLVVMLGAWFAGAAFLPVDIAWPAARRRGIHETARVRRVVTSEIGRAHV